MGPPQTSTHRNQAKEQKGGQSGLPACIASPKRRHQDGMGRPVPGTVQRLLSARL